MQPLGGLKIKTPIGVTGGWAKFQVAGIKHGCFGRQCSIAFGAIRFYPIQHGLPVFIIHHPFVHQVSATPVGARRKWRHGS